MRPLLIACAAAALVAVASGCSSGDGGPSSLPFNPFGTESSLPTGAEPTVSGMDPPPGGGAGAAGQSIPQLCAFVCGRIEAACPGGAGADCTASCSAAAPAACEAEFRGFLVCLSTAPISCIGGSASVSSCQGEAATVSNCQAQGGAGSL